MINNKLLSLTVILFLSIQSFCQQDEFCKESDSNGQCIECKETYVLINNTCVNCDDPNCSMCKSQGEKSCLKCTKGFILTNKKCGVECSNLDNCKVCAPDLSECYKCSYGCPIKNGKCSCKSKIILIVILVVIALIVIQIIILCITRPLKVRRYKIAQLALNIMPGFRINENEDYDLGYKMNENHNCKYLNYNNNNDININTENEDNHLPQLDVIITDSQHAINKEMSDSQMINQTESKDNDKGICDYCLIENAIVKLSCGCSFCIKHKILLNKGNNQFACPVCKNNYNSIEAMNCSLCQKSKNIINIERQTNCECKLPVCQECFDKLSEHKCKCPGCLK